jgi:hypothetical protein
MQSAAPNVLAVRNTVLELTNSILLNEYLKRAVNDHPVTRRASAGAV